MPLAVIAVCGPKSVRASDTGGPEAAITATAAEGLVRTSTLAGLEVVTASVAELAGSSTIAEPNLVLGPGIAAPDPSLDVVVLGAPVARAPGSAHVLTERQLERFEYDDAQAVLSGVPGVYARTEDGIGLRPNIGIRGVNPDRSKKITLMEDGVLFAPAPYSAPAAYYFPLVTRMSQVRVIKGPGAVRYGPNTVGGAVDFVTRAVPEATEGAIDLAAGAFGYGKLAGHFGAGTEATGFLLEGVHLRETGFKTLPVDADTGSRRNEWMLKARHRFRPGAAERSELQLKLTYSDEVSNETYLGLTDADLRATPRARYGASKLDQMRWHRISGVLSFQQDLAPGVLLEANLYRHDLDRTWRKVNGFRDADLFDILSNTEDAQNQVYWEILRGRADTTAGQALLIGPNHRQLVSQGLETRLRVDGETGPLTHGFETGARIHYDRVARRHTEDAYAIVGGELIPNGSPTMTTAFNEASTYALALHVADALTWDRLTLSPGLRFEILRSASVDKIAGQESRAWSHVVLPGIGAYYALTRALGVLAGVHRGFAPPPPGDPENNAPETSVNYEAGLRFVRGLLRGELIGYYNDYSNLIDVCTVSSGCSDANLDQKFDAGRARIYGLEALAEHEVPVGFGITLPLSASYTLTRTEFRRTFASDDPIFGAVQAGDEMPYVPKHQARVSAGVAWGPASLNAALTYVGRMREVAGRGPFDPAVATEEQVLVDLGGAFRLLDVVSMYVQIRNLTDQAPIVSRRPFGARTTAPRWIQVGVKLASF